MAILLPGLYLGGGLALLYLPSGEIQALLTMGAGAGLILLLLTYTLGFLLHRLAGRVQIVWWGWIHGGQPTDWVLQNRGSCPHRWAVWTDRSLVSETQMDALADTLPAVLPVAAPDDELRFPEEDADSIRRQVYTYVSHTGDTTRIARMSGNHRMGLGILTANLLLSILYMLEGGQAELVTPWEGGALLLVTTLVAFSTIIQSGQHYAKELFTTFLTLSRGESS